MIAMIFEKSFKNLIVLFAVAFCAVFFVGANQTSALIGSAAKSEACKGAELDNSAGSKCGDAAATSTKSTITTVIGILSAVGAIMAVIVIIINGIRLVLSNGDSNRIGTARTGIIMALVGLIVIAAAQLIVRFVAGRVG